MPIPAGFFTAILTNLAFSIPLMIVWIVGIILAIVTWKKHPRASICTLIAFVIFFINNILSAVTSMLPIYLSDQLGYSYARIGTIQVIVNIVFEIFAVGGWILLLIAIFSRRKEMESKAI